MGFSQPRLIFLKLVTWKGKQFYT